MRLLGIDYGSVRIGLALSDPTGSIASPAGTLSAVSQKEFLAQLSSLCTREKVCRIVIGLPKHMNGEEGESAKKARALGDTITRALNLPVVYHDERLSSAAAERSMLEADLSRKKRKENIDAMAAALILQGYLDLHSISDELN